MAMSSTKNETIEGVSGLGWGRKIRVTSVSFKMPVEHQVEKLSVQWEAESWNQGEGLVGERDLGVSYGSTAGCWSHEVRETSHVAHGA